MSLEFLEKKESGAINKDSLKHLSELSDKLIQLRESINFCEQRLKEFEKKEKQLSSVEIPELLLGLDLSSITLADGSVVEVKKEVYVSLPKTDIIKKNTV